ncbi:MAG: alpha/beta hydrolase [Microbacterium sp.]|nr:alpha/beta hydrolase [Microbacterium sp.]
MTASDSATLDLNGADVFYRTFGSPEHPPLVLVHGLYGDAVTVAPLAERLSDRFRVIAPDALGHGRSARPEGFTLADQGRMLNALVAALGYDAAAMVGISMGSYLTAQAAIDEHARVARLVLVVSKAHGTTSSSVAYAKRMGFDLAAASPDELLAFMSGAIWSPDTTPERRAEIMARIGEQTEAVVLSPAEQAAVERSLAGFDLRPDLHRIAVPTLVISGKDDGLNPPSSGEELARGVPGARFEVYEHSGHMLTFEETDRLVAYLQSFLLDD